MYKLIKVGDLANIQFKEYLFNSYADMINFDTNLLNFADKATIVENGESYIFNSSSQWILQPNNGGGSSGVGVNIEIVDSLPTTDISITTIYFILKEDSLLNNIYNEYMYINNEWELIDSTEIDLTNYYTKDEVDELIDTEDLLEIKLPIYGHIATEIPTSINLDESSWDNIISVNTNMNNGKYPNVLLTFFAGDTGFNTEIGTTIYQTVVKPKQFIVEIDNENVGIFTLDVTMVDGVQISIIADDLTSADRTVTFIQKVFCSQEDLSTAIGDINSVLDSINGEVIE